MNRKIKAFTLIELVIAITVIIVLSLVSVPIYKDHVLNAKMSEGYLLLDAIKNAQLNYYSEYEYFLIDSTQNLYRKTTCYEAVLGIDARVNKHFKTFNINSTWSGGTYYKIFAVARSTDLGDLNMVYDITSGVTFFK